MPSPAARAATLELTYGAKLGDREALAGLFEAHSDKLRRHLRTRTDDECAADDAAQEAWVRVARSIGKFDPTKGTFQTWLFTIGRNALRDMHRSGYSRKEGLTADMLKHDRVADETAVRDTEQQIAASRLAAEVKSLPRKQRIVLIHRFWTNLSLAETADLMGTNVNAVKQLQFRACRKLAEQLGEEADELLAHYAAPDSVGGLRLDHSRVTRTRSQEATS